MRIRIGSDSKRAYYGSSFKKLRRNTLCSCQGPLFGRVLLCLLLNQCGILKVVDLHGPFHF